MDIKHTYIFEWVGPFYSIEELKKWESTHKSYEYHSYVITGIPKNKSKERAYFGITQNKKKCVSARFNKDHHVRQMREIDIWIGKFSDPSKLSDRRNIELCETMLISYCQPELNKKKKAYYPPESIAIINRWFKLDLKPRARILYSAQREIPDVLIYDRENKNIWGSYKIKKLLSVLD